MHLCPKNLRNILTKAEVFNKWKSLPTVHKGRPLGGASGAVAPGANFEGALKRRSPTGHMSIRSTAAW
jgi:hypothetical protein